MGAIVTGYALCPQCGGVGGFGHLCAAMTGQYQNYQGPQSRPDCDDIETTCTVLSEIAEIEDQLR